MERAFYSIAVLCLAYYIVLIYHTKNIKTNFAWFWAFSAVLSICLGVITSILPEWGVRVINILFIAWVLFFLATEIVIFCGMLVMPAKKCPVIIVLGAHVNEDGPCDTLKRRLQKALTLLLDDKEMKVIVSGGKGRGESQTEAKVMADFFKTYGITSDRILIEDRSGSTKENLEYSMEILEDIKEQDKPVGIVTNNFHMYRAIKQAKICGYQNPRGIMAGVDYILFLNYIVREFFCVIHMYLR